MKNLKKYLPYLIYIILTIPYFSESIAQDTTFIKSNTGVYADIYIHDMSLIEMAFVESNHNNYDTSYYTHRSVSEAGLLLFIVEYDKYENYCYNDSTLIETPYSCDIVGCLVNHTGLTTWIHKQPDFMDFIAWVRKKYNY